MFNSEIPGPELAPMGRIDRTDPWGKPLSSLSSHVSTSIQILEPDKPVGPEQILAAKDILIANAERGVYDLDILDGFDDTARGWVADSIYDAFRRGLADVQGSDEIQSYAEKNGLDVSSASFKDKLIYRSGQLAAVGALGAAPNLQNLQYLYRQIRPIQRKASAPEPAKVRQPEVKRSAWSPRSIIGRARAGISNVLSRFGRRRREPSANLLSSVS